MELNLTNVEKARRYLHKIWPSLLIFAGSNAQKQRELAKRHGWIIVYDDMEFYAQSPETIRISTYEPERVLCYPSLIEGVIRYGNPDKWIGAILGASHEPVDPGTKVNQARKNWALATSIPGLIPILLAK